MIIYSKTVKAKVLFVFGVLSITSWFTPEVSQACNLNPLTHLKGSREVCYVSSNLPVFQINTQGLEIERKKKIPAEITMGELKEHPIRIRRRGQSSDGFPQKQYLIEFISTKDQSKDLKMPLLGMTKDSQWAFHAPYVDKSLMRNAVAYELARSLPDKDGKSWYAPRTRFAELILNDKYQGAYTVIEKIGVGKKKVDIKTFDPDSDPEVILKADPVKDDDLYFTTSKGVNLIYEYPGKNKLMNLERDQYVSYTRKVEFYLNLFEENADLGLIDIDSFVNYILIQELLKNIDGYRRSVYLHIKGGKIYAGPVWDFNLAMGNLWFYRQRKTDGWQHGRHYIDGNKEIPWFKKLIKNKTFKDKLIERYRFLRQEGHPFDERSIFNLIDNNANQLAGASDRHFTRWNLLGGPLHTFWFTPPQWPSTYEGEIKKLKKWFHGRLGWMDKHIEHL